MSKLQEIHSGRRQQPPRMLIYGLEGIGKSTLAASAPKPIFIPTEVGLDQIECDSFPLAHSFEDVMSYLESLATEAHDYQTVVIDSLDWLERLIWDAVCKRFGAKNIEKVDGGYGKGFSHALTEWRQVIDILRYLREEKGMLVLLLAHSKIEKFTDPESTPFDRFSPRLNKQRRRYCANGATRSCWLRVSLAQPRATRPVVIASCDASARPPAWPRTVIVCPSSCRFHGRT